MLIRDIITEDTSEDMVETVADILTTMMANEHDKVSTKQLQSLMAMQGFNVSVDQLIMAAEQTGYTSSQNQEFIVVKSGLPDDLSQAPADQPEDEDIVGDLAQGQAMSDIDQDLV